MYSRVGILLELKGLIPSKKNSRITNRRTGRSFPSKAYTAWEKAALLQVAQQLIGRRFHRVLELRVHFWYGTRRRADNSNKYESVMDMLVKGGFLTDDNWQIIRRGAFSGRYRKGRDGALIRIIAKGA